jgi:hypothetical protein
VSPLSWPVVAGALLLGSPALWATAVTRTLPTDPAAARVGLCLLASWAALSVVTALSERALSARPPSGAAETDPEMQRPADVDLG